MKRFLVFFLFVPVLHTQNIDFLRWQQWGPQTVFPGHTFLYTPTPRYSYNATCSSTDSTCTSAAYVPLATDLLIPSDQNLTAGGIPTQPYGSWLNIPAYFPANISGASFNLQPRAYALNTSTGNYEFFQETSWLSSAGTSVTVTGCPDGTWPLVSDYATNTGLTFTGPGSTHTARFQATTVGGVIQGTPGMIDGGGNFTAVPATGSLTCITSKAAEPWTATTYTVAFTGGALSTAIPITASGNVTFHINNGGHGVGRPWLKDVAGTGWPAGTTMTYWHGNSTYAFAYLLAGVPPPGKGMQWLPWSISDGSYMGVEVSIPPSACSSATPCPQTFNAGWTFCIGSTDANATNCVDMTKAITLNDVPDYPLATPTSPPPLPAAFTSATAPCYNPYGTTTVSTQGDNCAFSNVLTSETSKDKGYGYWFPLATRHATAPSNPDYQFELNSPPQYVIFSAVASQQPQSSSAWMYDGAKTMRYIAEWTGDVSWLNPMRALLSRYDQIYPGVPGVAPYTTTKTRPYNTQGLDPINIGSMWTMNPVSHADGLAIFNNGQYSDTPVARHWNSQIATGLVMVSNTSAVPSTQTGTGSAMPVGYPTGAGNPSVIDAATGGFNAGIRYPAYQMLNKLTVARTLGKSISMGSCVAGVNNCFAFEFKLATEVLQTLGLEMLDPPISGRFDMGTMADQFWMMGGLYLEAVINHYEFTHDRLDLFIIKGLLDRIKTYYVSSTHQYPQSLAPNGLTCTASARLVPGHWWNLVSPSQPWCAEDPPVPVGSTYSGYGLLNGMLAYQYAWWWSHFGGSDNTFANFADTMAMDGLSHSAYGPAANRYTPKSENETFGRYAFWYLAERQLRRSLP
jgi:hypothetical protein